MLRAANFPLPIVRRQPFILVIGLRGADYTALDFSFEVRDNPSSDQALLSFTKGAGITATFAMVNGQPYTEVRITATKETILTLPESRPLGADWDVLYAFKVQGLEYMAGTATIRAAPNHL